MWRVSIRFVTELVRVYLKHFSSYNCDTKKPVLIKQGHDKVARLPSMFLLLFQNDCPQDKQVSGTPM